MATHTSTSSTHTTPVDAQRGPLGNISPRLAVVIALLVTTLLGTLVAFLISSLLV